MPNRGLPFARGYREDQTSQQEAFDQRRRSEPLQNEWTITTGDVMGGGTLVGGTSSVDTLRLVRVPRRVRDLSATKVSLRVTVGAAGEIQTAVYVYDSNDRSLNLVSGSGIAFDTATAARLTKEVDFNFLADEQYFIANTVSSATPQFAHISLSSADVNPMLFISADSTPAKIASSEIQQEFTNRTPIIIYYSAEAALLYE